MALREWVLGRTQVTLEEPDLLVVRMGGVTAGLEVARALTGIYREQGTRQPFFAIIDIKDSPADAEARSYFIREIRLEWFRGVVFVGAGIIERAITKALMVGFLFTGRSKLEFLYADSVEDGRGLVARMRAKPTSG